MGLVTLDVHVAGHYKAYSTNTLVVVNQFEYQVQFLATPLHTKSSQLEIQVSKRLKNPDQIKCIFKKQYTPW